jgi:hypothetical protein
MTDIEEKGKLYVYFANTRIWINLCNFRYPLYTRRSEAMQDLRGENL